MNVGDLFVNLGIKGADKTIGALGDTKKAIGDVASVSLEAKAAIVGAMYALERLFAASGATGTNLTNFNALLGEGTQTIQQYEYAARKMGLSNQEVESTFKALSDSMTKVALGQGRPAGLTYFGSAMGMAPGDIKKFMQQPELLLQKMQEFAAKEKNIPMRNFVLKSFGITDNMIAGLVRGVFNPNALKEAQKFSYNDSQLKNLDKANQGWITLGATIEKAVGDFNAKYGATMVSSITQVVTELAKLPKFLEGISKGKTPQLATMFKDSVGMVKDLILLVEKLGLALDTLATKIGFFERIASFSTGIANSVKLLNEVLDRVSGKGAVPGDLTYTAPNDKTASDALNSPMAMFIKDWAENQSKMRNELAEKTRKELEGDEAERRTKVFKTKQDLNQEPFSVPAVPAVPAIPGQNIHNIIKPKIDLHQTPKDSTTQNVNINQNLNFQHEGKESKQTADSLKTAMQNAFRQFPQGQIA